MFRGWRVGIAKAVREAPALSVTSLLGAAAALVVAFAHLSPTKEAVVSSLATVIGTIVAAFLTRPVHVSVISGAAGTLLLDLTIFGVHLDSAQTGAVVAGITLGLGALMHLLGVATADTGGSGKHVAAADGRPDSALGGGGGGAVDPPELVVIRDAEVVRGEAH